MKIPKKLKIGGHIYRIKHRNNRWKEDGIDKSGSCLSFHNTIWVDTSAKQSQQETAFIHEILEAINNETDLKLDHTQIQVLEFGLYQVFKDNHLLNEI